MFEKFPSIINLCSRRLSMRTPSGFDWAKHEKILMEPFEYIQKVPSKYHPMMATSFNPWLQVPDQKLDKIQEAMQTMMTWTILLDDIQDNSAFRYGVPSAHRVFGAGLTINAANNALLLGQRQIKELEHPLAMEKFLKVMDEFFYGQGIDIYWREKFICPTAQEHIDMTKKKSGTWFALPVELMQLFSSNKTDYSELANDVGAYYHMVDDYFNLFDPKALEKLAKIKHENHTSCNDITECKFTLPIIHALQLPDVASELADILKQRTSDPKLVRHAIELLKKHGCDKYAKDVLRKIQADIHKEIEQFGGNKLLTKFMDDLRI